MPRTCRKKSFTKVYHVIIRGINKQDLFFDKQDIKKFIKELDETKEKNKIEIYAYAFMKNHVHLIIYDVCDRLSVMMQSLNIRYSLYFNKKYDRVGHVFENRFKSHAIEDINYLKNLTRYIHKNPQKAGLKKYENTSYYEYLNKEAKLISREKIMNIFGNDINNFIKYHENYIENQDYNKDYEMIYKISDDEAIEIMKDISNEKNLIKIQNYEIKERHKIIKKFIQIEGITKTQISRILGISEKTIINIGKEM